MGIRYFNQKLLFLASKLYLSEGFPIKYELCPCNKGFGSFGTFGVDLLTLKSFMHSYELWQLRKLKIKRSFFSLVVDFVLFSTLHNRESGEPSKRKPYLPPEKQFLITRNGKSKSSGCI